MKRRLLRQMLTEWRSNIWLVLELVIVGACLFFVNFILFNLVRVYLIPEGYDGRGTVVVKSQYLDQESPSYIEYDSIPGEEDFRKAGRLREKTELIRRLGTNPLVQEIGYGPNSMPYNLSFSGYLCSLIVGEDTLICCPNSRTMTPSYIDIIKVQGYGNTTRQQLREALERNEVLVSANIMDELNKAAREKGLTEFKSPDELLGRTVQLFDGDFKIGGIIQNMKRGQYEEPKGSTLIMRTPVNPSNESYYYNLAVSLKPGVSVKQFIEDIQTNLNSIYAVGNLKISSLVPTERIMKEEGRSERMEMLSSSGCIVFLCMSIFLGLLGTFWFRTRQRVKEIAIRIVNGAGTKSIFARLVSEAIVLLAIATPFILYIEYLIYKNQLGGEYMNPEQPFSYIVWTNFLTFGALLLMILAGVMIPALKVIKVSPAESLQED